MVLGASLIAPAMMANFFPRTAEARLCRIAAAPALQKIHLRSSPSPLLLARQAHYGAFEANLDEADLAEARQWRKTFDGHRLPQGNTTFARSSGPGGQHVNKYASFRSSK